MPGLRPQLRGPIELKMSEVSQFGQQHSAPGTHPDADQLSAFMEQALPAHERDGVLAHLAACRDCRETIALAMPAGEVYERVAVAAPLAVRAASVEVAAASAVAVRRRPWFARWAVWIPAAAALAAVALFVEYVGHAPQPSIQQQARMATPQAGTQLPGQAKIPEAGEPPSQAATTVVEPGTVARGKNALTREMARDRIVSGAQAPAASGPAVQMAPPPAAAPGRMIDEQSKASQPERFAQAGMAGAGTAAAPAPADRAPQMAAQAEGRSIAGGTIHGSNLMQPPPAPQPPAAAAQSVVESAGRPIETTPVEITNSKIAAKAVGTLGTPITILATPLPSRQAVLSDASYGGRIVALDVRHALFLSEDSGAHWKRVSGPWQGQAVGVNLVLGESSNGVMGMLVSGRNFSAAAGRSQPPVNGPQGSLTGTVTDMTGAVIPGATVTVTDAATRNTRNAKTDAKGRYDVEGLMPGNYDVKAAAQGFEELRLGGIAVDAARANVANLTLKVGAVSEAVTVEAARPEVEVERAEAGESVAAPMDKLQPPAIFAITTDTGERWTSADGQTWKRE
jgi:hypothetical protein